jgi:hypothetical protein
MCNFGRGKEIPTLRTLREYAIAIGVSIGLLLAILWIDGFDFSLGGTLSWSDWNDHPTDWLDAAQHPLVTSDSWQTKIF